MERLSSRIRQARSDAGSADGDRQGQRDDMHVRTATPKCPHCGSTEPLATVEQEHQVTTLLVLYCSSCGAILGAANRLPHLPDLRRRGSPVKVERRETMRDELRRLAEIRGGRIPQPGAALVGGSRGAARVAAGFAATDRRRRLARLLPGHIVTGTLLSLCRVGSQLFPRCELPRSESAKREPPAHDPGLAPARSNLYPVASATRWE